MRFRKGSKVEVLSKRETPAGSWFCAEVVSGNRYYYNVKYDGDHVMEKVQKKAIRPCPPLISKPRSWASGDIVEVLENNSWKAAKIVQVLEGGNYAAVTPIGSSEELKLHISNVRLQQSWTGDRWVLVNKESERLNEGNMEISANVGKFNQRKMQQSERVKGRKGYQQFHKNDKNADECCQISLRGLKMRSHLYLPTLEADGRAGIKRKMGAIKKEGKRQRLLAAHTSKLPEKVDACDSSRIILGEKYTGASLNNRTTGFPESGMNWENPNEDVHFFLGSLEHSESDNHSSSVGSCSPSSSPYRSPDKYESNPIQNVDFNVDNVEVSSGSRREPSELTRDGGAAEIHQLELNAYHSIMLALYASGPLSWEREALLTNLRLMLHITNDEHLLELRHLNNYQK